MPHEHGRKLRAKLENLKTTPVPEPWRQVAHAAVGGLTAVGFAEGTDDLLVVSSQGRGLFDCLSGERLARDRDETSGIGEGLSELGIGKYADVIIPTAGLYGGGLVTVSRDGWVIDVVRLPWPRHVIFLSSDYGGLAGPIEKITKICDDEPCSFRTTGFSETERSFVVATSCDVRIFAR